VSPRTRKLLFTVLAPISVPVYILFLIFTNLLAGAYYIVVESSLAKLMGKPLELSPRQFWLLALPVLLLAPVALVGHLIIGLGRGIVGYLAWVGRWQTGGRRPALMVAFGALWNVAAIWVTLTCLDAALGLSLVGQPIVQENRDAYVRFEQRFLPLGELPAELQARRKELIRRLADEGFDDAWLEARGAARLIEDPKDFNYDDTRLAIDLARLLNDDARFRRLPPTFRYFITDVPWFFTPAELSNTEDGQDRSLFLKGPLLFCWLLLICWPGTRRVLRWRWLSSGFFLLRIGVVLGSIYYLVSWQPITHVEFFNFGAHEENNFIVPNAPGWLFKIGSPLLWGEEPFIHEAWVRPHWVISNAALWLVILGIATFTFWMGARLAPFVGWPRYYIAFLASRLLQRKRIAFFSVGAVTLCVAMMIIVKSVMGGFVDSIRERAHGLLGDFVVDGALSGFPYYEEFIVELKSLKDERTGEPLVAEATPLIHSYGLIQFPASKETRAVAIRGIKLDEYRKVNEFGTDLFYDNRYGDTVLTEKRGRPVYGLNENGKVVLPGKMDEHFAQKYLPSLTDEKRDETQRRFARSEREMYFPGPGVFDVSSATDLKPGYEGKEYPGVIIGRDVILRRLASGEYARNNAYAIGEPCFITLLPLTRGGDVLNEPPPKPLFRYVDDVRTGIHNIDSKTVYIDFAIAQELLQMGAQQRVDDTMSSPRCSQIQIKLTDGFGETREDLARLKPIIMDAFARVARRVPADEIEYRQLDNVDISTWEEMQRSFISAIQKEEGLVLIMFGVISVVAIFLILCIFYMIVQEKTRDVGILKSVGGSAEGITAIFLVYGAAIGLVGSIFGTILGTNFVTHINDVQAFLAQIDPGLRVWSPETYSFDQIPSTWKWFDVWRICLGAIMASVIGAAVPAIKAGRTWPVESLRYE